MRIVAGLSVSCSVFDSTLRFREVKLEVQIWRAMFIWGWAGGQGTFRQPPLEQEG